MLLPSKVKYRRWHKGRSRSRKVETRGTELSFGAFGLKAKEPVWLTSRQIEAARKAMTHHIKRGGKIWIRVFPDKPVTKKGDEVGMGHGKGSPDHYVAVIRPGRMLFEMDGVEQNLAKEAMRLASSKLPIKTEFIVRK